MTESTRNIWRNGFVPLLSTEALEALRDGLEADSPEILQGATTTPPPLQYAQEWPVEAACALGYCGWKGEWLETVAEVEEYWANLCYDADQRLGEPAAVRFFLNWYDDTPRVEMRRELLEEVNLALAARQGVAA